MNKKILLVIMAISCLLSAANIFADANVLVNPTTDRIAFNGPGNVYDVAGDAGLYIKTGGKWYAITETSANYKSICAYVMSCLNNGTSFFLCSWGTYSGGLFTSGSAINIITGVQNVKYY